MRDPQKTIGSLIDSQKVAFIGAVDEEGYPAVKCMLTPRAREGIRVIWFSTNTSSHHVTQYRANPKASVYVADRRFYRGVLLTGTMEISEEPEDKERLWQPGDTMYYPQGVTDPDYCVMKFTARAGRYYSNMQSQDFAIEQECIP